MGAGRETTSHRHRHDGPFMLQHTYTYLNSIIIYSSLIPILKIPIPIFLLVQETLNTLIILHLAYMMQRYLPIDIVCPSVNEILQMHSRGISIECMPVGPLNQSGCNFSE